MTVPKIQTEVVHSESKLAWNVVAVNHGDKYKIARIPYTDISVVSGQAIINKSKQQAYEHAVFISTCFNSTCKGNKRPLKSIIVPSINDLDEEESLNEFSQILRESGEAVYCEGVDY